MGVTGLLAADGLILTPVWGFNGEEDDGNGGGGGEGEDPPRDGRCSEGGGGVRLPFTIELLWLLLCIPGEGTGCVPPRLLLGGAPSGAGGAAGGGGVTDGVGDGTLVQAFSTPCTTSNANGGGGGRPLSWFELSGCDVPVERTGGGGGGVVRSPLGGKGLVLMEALLSGT